MYSLRAGRRSTWLGVGVRLLGVGVRLLGVGLVSELGLGLGLGLGLVLGSAVRRTCAVGRRPPRGDN